MLYPCCEVCSVRSNSAQSLTAHLESKGHQRRIMMQAALLCETALCVPNAQRSSGSGTSAGPTGPTGPPPKAVAPKEEMSSTLMHYRKLLPDVRVADEAMNKEVLSLLFQLVQLQIRRAEKFRESLPRAHKRCLAGMKEVAWAVSKPGQAKLVLIAPNIQIPCSDSILLTQVRGLISKCRDVGVPVIMGASRKQLGMAFRTSEGSKSTFKLMSAVALLDVSGAEQAWIDIMERFPSLPLATELEDVPETASDALIVPPDAAVQPSQAAPGLSSSLCMNGDDKRGLSPAASAVVDRVQSASLNMAASPQIFQKILESASVLLGQVVSLGSRISSSGGRLAVS